MQSGKMIILALLITLSATFVRAQEDTQGVGHQEPEIQEVQFDQEAQAPSALPSDPGGENMPPPPEIPSLEEVRQGKAVLKSYLPADFDFRIGVIGEFVEEAETYSGTQQQYKSPLILLDPRTGSIKIHASNFPARVIANSIDGKWVVAIAPSAAVEGTSGSANHEAAVSLNLITGEIKLIKEFPRHSNFQAVFSDLSSSEVYYCVNEPGSVNQIFLYSLETATETVVPAEGNRFYLYGIKSAVPRGLWVKDPLSLSSYPVLSLLDVQAGTPLEQVEFPGTSEVLARPDGGILLASITDHAEASIGYYQVSDKTYHQVADLVLTKPDLKWLHSSNAVIAKESTAARDRFLWIDLETGQRREIYSAYFTVGQWDISPDDKALVFIVKTAEDPYLFVVPLDPTIKGYNRIRLRDMHNVSWVGCLYPPASAGGGSSWLQKLIPNF